jgi:hypothetical protein
LNQSTHQDLTGVITAVFDAGLFSSLCSIYQFPDPEAGGVNAWGQIDLTNSTPVAGLQLIPCMFAPQPQGAPGSNEKRGSEVIEQFNVFHVLLSGYFDSIVQKQIARIDGTDYSILNVESDSQGIMTRLAVRLYAL